MTRALMKRVVMSSAGIVLGLVALGPLMASRAPSRVPAEPAGAVRARAERVAAADDAKRKPRRPNLASMIGTECGYDGPIPVGISAALASEAHASLRNNDSAHVVALMQGRRVTLVKGSGRARVVDADRTNTALKIRVLSGERLGMEGWTIYGYCK